MQRGKIIQLITIGILLSIFGVSCKRTESPSGISLENLAVRDDLGRVIILPKHLKRAISLAPNLTEIAFAVGGGEKVVGDTTFCNYPEAAQNVAKVGDTLKPNIETILSLKPQVVFVSTASQLESFTKTLESQGIKVFVSNPNSLDGIYRSIANIGLILDRSSKANSLVDEMKHRVEAVAAKTKNLPKPNAFVQIDRSLYTVGSSSFIADLVQNAGGKLATQGIPDAYFKISKEKAIALNPEVIIVSDSADNDSPNEVFSNSTAVKDRKVLKMNADILSRPGPRSVDAIEQMASFFHPAGDQK